MLRFTAANRQWGAIPIYPHRETKWHQQSTPLVLRVKTQHLTSALQDPQKIIVRDIGRAGGVDGRGWGVCVCVCVCGGGGGGGGALLDCTSIPVYQSILGQGKRRVWRGMLSGCKTATTVTKPLLPATFQLAYTATAILLQMYLAKLFVTSAEEGKGVVCLCM